MFTRKNFVAAATAITVSISGITAAGADELASSQPSQKQSISSKAPAGSMMGLATIAAVLGASGWAAVEWLKQHPQQLTLRF